MKLTGLAIFALAMMSFSPWQTNFSAARQEAQQNHKLILLNFSGSDWCGPCIRLHKEVFESSAFTRFADSSLVLVNADFPRQKKHQLSKDVQHENELLAEKYNSKGAFPFTVLLDADGNILKSWEGLPKETPDEFVNEIDAQLHEHR